MNIFNYRTDMADERVDEYKKIHNLSQIDGIKVVQEKVDDVIITTVDVINKNGSTALNKPIGKYITLELKDIEYMENEQREKISKTLSKQIKKMYDEKINSLLIVGLGNEYITPDALGHRVISKLNITRHILKYAKELITEPTRELSAISPSVMGMTGIETEEIVQGVVNNVKPDIVIAVDSLCSTSIDRIGTTIQLCNTGITPGAGLMNERKGLNEQMLNVPVIAVGVPTVCETAVIINDYLKQTKNVDEYSTVRENLDKKDYNMIVTPKGIDVLIDNMASLIAQGINLGT